MRQKAPSAHSFTTNQKNFYNDDVKKFERHWKDVIDNDGTFVFD